MSFLSGLFCCFDSDDSSKKEIHSHSNNKNPPNSLKSKKSLSSNHRASSNTSLNQLNRPKLSKTQSNLQKALTHSNNNINNNSRTNSKSNILSSDTSKVDIGNSKIVPAEKSDLKSISPDKKKSLLEVEPNNNSTSSSTIKLPDQAKSTEYTKMVEELSDVKDSSNSSKNEEDIIQIHENQTQNTDDLEVQNNNNKNNNNDNNNNNASANTNFNKNDDANPISNIDPYSDPTTALDFEEKLYDEQFGLDLTKILPDQTVAKSGWLLDEKPKSLKNKKCLVLDLDETLVHSSFKFVRQCDFVIPVEIENQIHNVYVIKRPGVDQFLKRVGQLYEVVVFTASVARYGDPLLDILDSHKSIHQRLFRDSCYNYQGNYIKNLSQMGRPLQDLIIIDNSPASYVFHPQHAVPISSWFSDSHDCELTDLLPFLEDLASTDVDDVRLVLDINI